MCSGRGSATREVAPSLRPAEDGGLRTMIRGEVSFRDGDGDRTLNVLMYLIDRASILL